MLGSYFNYMRRKDKAMEHYKEYDLVKNKSPFASKNGIPDWSTVHNDSEGLGQTPSNKEEWEKYMLSKEDIKEFNRNGYLANKRVLSEKQCDIIMEEYQKILDLEENSEERELFYEYHSNQSEDTNNVLMHALGHWRVSRYFHDLVFYPAMTVPTAQLLSDGKDFCKVRFWHDQLFAKPAKYGGVVAWHQDYSYWTRTIPMRHMTVHIALEDQTLENGCIQYIPGSQKWTRDGKPLPVTDFNFADMESIHTILTEEEREAFMPKPCLLKKGEASFHHPLAVHGSYQNRSDTPRRAAVLNYFADGVKSNTDDLTLSGTYIIPKGNKMGGQFFPVVFDPHWINS